MSELCKQVTDTNYQPNSLCFTVGRLLEIQATTMACPPIMSESITPGTAFPAIYDSHTQSSTKLSGHHTMDPAIITSQQFQYMPAHIPFHDLGNVSILEGYVGYVKSVTPFPGLYRHMVVWQGTPSVGAPLPIPHQPPRTPQYPSGTQISSHPQKIRCPQINQILPLWEGVLVPKGLTPNGDLSIMTSTITQCLVAQWPKLGTCPTALQNYRPRYFKVS